ncbi:protein kinase [Hortaea werneckii]|nr:protein kinase [Hortaea werneckii]
MKNSSKGPDGRPTTRQDGSSDVILLQNPVEEETVPNYDPARFFPVHLGAVLRSRYHVVAKLGFGTSSTVWLCRDEQKCKLVAVKICTCDGETTQESAISHHINSIEADHPGKQRLRVALDEFYLSHASNKHQCFVFAPLGLTYTQFRNAFSAKRLNKDILKQSLLMILLGLDFLHQAGVVHTDLSPNNILLGVENEDALTHIEEVERNSPLSRKPLEDRVIYTSHDMPLTYGAPVISDFGAARLGEPEQKHSGDVMPGVYRAPEIILGMQWDSKIDVWSVGLMIWDLFEGGRLFRAVRHGHLDDEQHLAEMVSLLGPPPKEFLERSKKCRQYWDADGNWISATPIPNQTLESRETQLVGEEHVLLIKLARKMLCWLPEERSSAGELLEDEFLNS